jgi:Protein of unknown function (DUF3311)
VRRAYRALAVIPAAAILGAPFVANRVEPLVLGMPVLLAWIVGCGVLTSATVAVIYMLDQRHP